LFAGADDFNLLIMQPYPFNQPQEQSFKSLSPDSVKIAYFIMVHDKPERFVTLFQKIYSRDQIYLIHIDRKAKAEVTEEIQLFLIQYPNAYILESMNIISGGFSMIQAELDAMEFLLNVSKDWDYFINLSGEDYPLKSQYIIRQFLSIRKGKNYLFYYDQKFYRPDTLQRIQNHFTELAHKISSLIYKREFMKDVVPYIGGKWVILTRDTCAFLSNNKKVMDFEDYYLNTLLPGDSFFQTVLMNTSFHDIIVNDDKRAVIGKKFCTTESPEEFIEYLKLNNQLFIRKIDDNTDESIIQYISESYDHPLPDVNEIERELKAGGWQNN
jgi:hypothetical protein